MKRTNLLLLSLFMLILLAVGAFIAISGKNQAGLVLSEDKIADVVVAPDEIASLYQEMRLEGMVNYDAFRQAVAGFNRIDSRNKDILALVDFSRPSTEERLFIFDIKNKETLFVTHVSHGRNSGDNYATSFSNVNGSYQSSLGFFLTENTYQGRNGYSLVLEGLEPGINDKAKERAIVMHGASYANPSIIVSNGRLGRSLGCPAVPESVARPIIDTLKEGAVLYIFADSPDYPLQSTLLS